MLICSVNHECYTVNLYCVNGMNVDVIKIITTKDTKTQWKKFPCLVESA